MTSAEGAAQPPSALFRRVSVLAENVPVFRLTLYIYRAGERGRTNAHAAVSGLLPCGLPKPRVGRARGRGKLAAASFVATHTTERTKVDLSLVNYLSICTSPPLWMNRKTPNKAPRRERAHTAHKHRRGVPISLVVPPPLRCAPASKRKTNVLCQAEHTFTSLP